MPRLHVNVDHVATLRAQRGTAYPDPVEAARLALRGGADGITVHLREDRRHIRDGDLEGLRGALGAPLNMEMAFTEEMIGIALRLRPDICTIVPEKREERTTERGLRIGGEGDRVTAEGVARLVAGGIRVSLFVDPEERIVRAAAALGADTVELHTGEYCGAGGGAAARAELARLEAAAAAAAGLGLHVAAGHGLDYANVRGVLRLPGIEELNIGHSIVCRAVLAGMEAAVREMKEAIA